MHFYLVQYLWLFYLLTSNVKYIIIACLHVNGLLNVLHYLLLMHCFLIISNVYKNNTNWFIYFDNVKKSYTSALIPSILLCLSVYVALYNVNASKRGTNKNKKKAFLYLKCIKHTCKYFLSVTPTFLYIFLHFIFVLVWWNMFRFKKFHKCVL